MKPKYVWLFIAGFILAVFVFDVYLYSDGVPGNSITQVIITASGVSNLVPWAVGFLMGFLAAHFFDTYQEPRD